jgi:hypothetical protein
MRSSRVYSDPEPLDVEPSVAQSIPIFAPIRRVAATVKPVRSLISAPGDRSVL